MQRQILIIDDHNDLAEALDEVFSHLGHNVQIVISRREALAITDIEHFDLVITDLDVDPASCSMSPNGSAPVCLPTEFKSNGRERVKAFKICASNFRREDFDEDELKSLVATVLDIKLRNVDREEYVREIHESIEFELPGVISIMHVVLDYLMRRVEKLGVVRSEQSNLFVALDEAFVNAVKHGNKFDPTKNVRVAAEVSKQEARFTIEDEGEGFDFNSIPDPLDPENLFKPSGRGVLFIYNIMDEVEYSKRGNRLTMVKRSDAEPAA
jgi:serine/threonine-protein kinase RsbW